MRKTTLGRELRAPGRELRAVNGKDVCVINEKNDSRS